MAAINTIQTNSVLKLSLYLTAVLSLEWGAGLSFDTLVTASICIMSYRFLWPNLSPALTPRIELKHECSQNQAQGEFLFQ